MAVIKGSKVVNSPKSILAGIKAYCKINDSGLALKKNCWIKTKSVTAIIKIFISGNRPAG